MKLNLGCGEDIRQGWWNGDIEPGTRAEHFDLTAPWPWQYSTVDEILISHVLEHLPPQSLRHVMGEAHRVLKPGGRLYIRVPFYRCFDAIEDPTHVRGFEMRSFQHLLRMEPGFDLALKLHVHPYHLIWFHEKQYSEFAYWVREQAAEAVSSALTWILLTKRLRAFQEWVPRWVASEWRAAFTRKP